MPTPAELATHHAAVAKLRAELFRMQTPADCFIVPGSERVVPLEIDERVSMRDQVQWGGLEFRVESTKAGDWYEVSVEHLARDEFNIFLVRHQGDGKVFTRFAMHRKFGEVAAAFRDAIDTARREDLPWELRNSKPHKE